MRLLYSLNDGAISKMGVSIYLKQAHLPIQKKYPQPRTLLNAKEIYHAKKECLSTLANLTSQSYPSGPSNHLPCSS